MRQEVWKATRVSADFANNIGMEAGILVGKFNVANPVKPKDEDIICTTTGNFSITCVAETSDFFEDVNNMPNNTKQGKRITGWNCGLTVSAIDITEKLLLRALGAAEVGVDGGVHPRTQYEMKDFKELYWMGDMTDDNKVFVVAMNDTVSTGGVSFTSSKNNKDTISLEFTAHASIEHFDVVPMAFYILEKVVMTLYTVTFDVDGGTGIVPQEVESGDKATQPLPPTKTGYTFDGWYSDSGLTTPWDFENDTITADTTIYAKWL